MLSMEDRDRLPVWQIRAEQWPRMRFSPPATQYWGPESAPVGLPGLGTSYWNLPERFDPISLCTALQATTLPMDLNEAVIDEASIWGTDICPVPLLPPGAKFTIDREPEVWAACPGTDQGEHLFTTYKIWATDQQN